MTTAFTTDTLERLTLAYIEASPASLRFTPVRTGKHNSSFWVEGEAGRYVLRIAPPDDAGFLFYERLMMRQEPELHALIRSATSIPVAEIVGFDFSRSRIDNDYLLMRVLPGMPISEARLNPSQFRRALYQVGQHLRALHALTAAESLGAVAHGYLGSHHPMDPQLSWVGAFRVMWNKLLDDVVACGGYTAEESDVFRQLFDTHKAAFDRPVVPRLLHMDVWSQNILVDLAGDVTGLVDFDRALWGDAEIEFAVLDYCGISEPSFWEGYGAERDVSPEAILRQQFYLLYEVQKYIPIQIWRRNDPGEASRYKRYCIQMAAQLM